MNITLGIAIGTVFIKSCALPAAVVRSGGVRQKNVFLRISQEKTPMSQSLF